MHYKFIAPPLPSLRRWRDLYRKFPGNSALRVLEYEKIQSLQLAGNFLDVGGGENARYTSYLPQDLDLKSINIDPDINPTYLLKPLEPFPIKDNVFSGAICLNTLEHIYDVSFVLSEILRVLKPGGSVYITVPFIFRIHGHPDDYMRATPSWWRETLSRTGFAAAELQPLIWGRYTAAGSISGYRGLLPARFQFHWSHIKDVLYARLMFMGKQTYEGRRGERICAVAPGWFITATKAK